MSSAKENSLQTSDNRHSTESGSRWHPTPFEWAETQLHSLLAHVIGGDWGKDIEYNDDTFIDVMCIRGTEFRHWDTQHGKTAVPRKIKPSSLVPRKLQIGDILIEISGGGPDQPVGRTVLITKKALSNFRDKPAVCTNFLRLARPTELIVSTYLNYYLQYFYKSGEVTKYQGGSNNLRNLKFKEYETITTPLPPLAEQKVIADKLDELLAQVDTLKARLDAIPAILKRFRQSVLAAAVSGKLTEEWLETQNHLRKSFKTTVFNIAQNEKYSLSIGPFGSNLKVIDYKDSGHPLVFVRDIRSKNFGGPSTKYISDEKFNELLAHRVCPGDILITKMGDPPGDVAIYPKHQPEAVITSDCIKLSVNPEIADKYFIALTMMSDQFRAQVFNISAGVAQQKVNLKNFKALTIEIPSLEEQTEIVRRVEQLFIYADQVEQQVKNAQARVNQLTQSILAKAFRGELTEQWRQDNPELISGDNSAAALLERIKAERAAATTSKKKAPARKAKV